MTEANQGAIELMLSGGGHGGEGPAPDEISLAGAGLAAAVAGWRALRAALDRDATAAEAAAEACWAEVLERLLGDLNDAGLTDLEARVGVPGLLSLRDEHDDRIAAAQARRAALVEMEEVTHPTDVAARIEAELAAVGARLAELEPELRRWEASPAYRALRRRGFFAEGYAPGRWGRWRDRRRLARLVAEVGLASDAEDLAAAVVAARTALGARIDGARALETRLLSRRGRQAALERERAALTDAPSRLHAEMRRALAAAVREHLDAGPVELRYELARDDAELAAAFRRVAGLAAKARYLRQLAVARVERRLGLAEEALARGAPADDAASARELAAVAALDRLRGQLVAFDAWDQGGLGGHVLWWDRMTGGAPADDLPEVRAFLDTWGGPVAPDHPTAPLEAELRQASAAPAASANDDDVA